ncbi:MAG: flagellar hook protein FlgE, partial [Planctomycetaceae bacterium]|nr:flagellar hook protein FlgE [Planctomycetaceae bacterium]
GLNSHQQMLNVIGNNIANLNTVGFKSRTAQFSDLLYTTLSTGSGGSAGVLGGTNPVQVGAGSRLSSVDLNLTQGNFTSTGSALDLAIDGDGYFVAQSGTTPVYTRAGSFRLDSAGFLVDPSTGFRVQRFGTVGEPDGVNPAFQTPGRSDINVPLGAVIPGQITSSASIAGNLPFDATGPLAQILTISDPLTTSGAPATAATLLNSLDSNSVDYAVGDFLTISGTDSDGSPVSVSMAVGPATTVGDLVAAVTAAYPSATASLAADGRIALESDSTGPAFLSIGIRDQAGNSGSTDFTTNPFVNTRSGKEADTVRGAFQVFDGRGDAHTVTVTFEKQPDGSWNVDASIPTADGTILDGTVTGLLFNDDGTFSRVSGSGTGDAALQFQFAGQTDPQTILLDFGEPNTFDGMISLTTSASTQFEQDGFGVGTLSSVRVNGDGTMLGIASNGRTIELAQLAIASFANPNGLEAVGQNYFGASGSSGNPQIGTALSGSRGNIRAGELEQSNVDLALEFTRLIVAQRGFSANARTITVSSQILEELTNLIR